MSRTLWVWVGILAILPHSDTMLSAAQLKVGTAQTNITPEKSVPLCGQFELRLSQGVKSPIYANVCAIEAVENDQSVDAAIFVSVDVVHIPENFAKIVRRKITTLDASIQPEKIVLFATHTHTAPTLMVGAELPKGENIEDYPETIENISTLIANAVVSAWQSRVPADFSWGLEQVVIGQSRRACYFDGHAQMYGNSNDPQFSHYENPSDPDLGTLFFWDKNGQLLSVVVNVACTSQVVEGLSVICADYWDPTRTKLHERFGKNVVIVACNAPAGDDSPHPQYRQSALARMRALRSIDPNDSPEERQKKWDAATSGDSEMNEIARRIDRAVADAYSCAEKDKKSDIQFAHHFEIIELPPRLVSEEEYQQAKRNCDSFKQALVDHPEKSPAEVAFMAIGWYGQVVARYEKQQAGKMEDFPANVHVIRLGDLVLATNQFELFADYGMRIKARSPATATFVIDLADGDGAYMPTDKAIRAGGYSAVVESDPVSAEGGQRLVNETLRIINDLWK